MTTPPPKTLTPEERARRWVGNHHKVATGDDHFPVEAAVLSLAFSFAAAESAAQARLLEELEEWRTRVLGEDGVTLLRDELRRRRAALGE